MAQDDVETIRSGLLAMVTVPLPASTVTGKAAELVEPVVPVEPVGLAGDEVVVVLV